MIAGRRRPGARAPRVIVALAAALLSAGGLQTAGLLPLPGAGSPAPAGASPAADAGIPASLLREMRPVGRGARFRPAAPARVAGRCDRGLGGRLAIHLELFAANRVVIVPAGIGARRPWELDAGRIAAARCYGGFVTADPSGVVQVSRDAHSTLAGLFAAWGRPLGSRRLLSFRGPVRLYVDGRRVRIAPWTLPLRGHDEIVLEVGPYVPPHPSYAFPPARGAQATPSTSEREPSRPAPG